MPPDNAAPLQPNAAPQQVQEKREGFFSRLFGNKAPPPADPAIQRQQRQQRGEQKRRAEALREVRKGADGRQKAAAARSKEETEYLHLLERADAVLQQLELTAPASDTIKRGVMQARTDAAESALGGHFALAVKQLTEVGLSKRLAAAQKEWDKARAEAEKAAKTTFGRLADMRARLADPAIELNRRDVRDFGAELDAAERELMVATRVKDRAQRQEAIATAAAPIYDVQRKVQAGIVQFRADRDLITQTVGDRRARMDQLAPEDGALPLIQAGDAGAIRKMLDAAEFAAADHDLPAATALCQQAGDRLAALAPTITAAEGARDSWALTWQPRLAQVNRGLDQLANNGSAPHLFQEAIQLHGSLQEMDPGRDISFIDAIARVREAEETLATLQAQDAQWGALHGAGDAAAPVGDPAAAFRGPVAELIAGIEAQLDDLHKTVKQRTGNKHTTIADGQIAPSFAKVKAEWDRKLGEYHDAKSLDGEGTLYALQAIQNELTALQFDDGRIDNAIDLGKLALAQLDYMAAKQVATDVAERHLAIDATEGGKALLRIEAIAAGLAEAGSSRDYRKAAAELNAIATNAREDMLSKQLVVKRAQDELEAALGPAKQKLDALRKAAGKASGGNQKALYAAVETLQAEYEQLRAMGSLSNLSVLQSVTEDVAALGQRIDELVQAGGGKAAPKPLDIRPAPEAGQQGAAPAAADAMLTFSAARKIIGKTRVALGKPDIKTYATLSAFTLGEELDKLEGSIGVLSRAELTQQVGALRGRLEAVQQEAGIRHDFVAAIESGPVAAVRNKMKGSAFADARAYRDAVERRLQALLREAQLVPAPEFEQVRSKGVAIVTELDGVAGPGGVTQSLLDKERDAQAANRRQAAAGGQWEAKKGIADRQLGALRAPKEAKAPLQATLAGVVDQVKTSGNFDAGIEQLDALMKRIALVAANPNGLAMAARNKLPAASGRVKRAVAEFNKGLDEMRAAIDGYNLDAEGKKQVGLQVSALRGLFVPATQVEAQVKAAAADGSTQEKRDAAREKALREVRTMQACLKSDHRLKLMASCPFLPSARTLVAELGLALLDIENNLLVSK